MDVARLFEEHHVPLCRYLLRFTGDADLAADAAQEAFVRLLERPPRSKDARAWLFKVATNAAVEAARTRNRRWLLLLRKPERAPQGDPPTPPDLAIESAERRSAVQRALLDLSAKERTALLMREEGFSQREIAEAIGTTTKSVGTLIARAIDKLTPKLGLARGDL
ncbi:sigma-70 family RNA polymerase sigma factor SigL [soil metagenome]